MGIFDGIKDATPNFSKNWLRAGHYYSLIGECKQGKNSNDHDMVVINHTVVRVIDDADGRGHKVFEDAVQMISKKPKMEKMFLGNIKTIIGNLLEVPMDEITQEECDQVFGQQQMLNGMVVEWGATEKPQANNPGKVFTNVDYKRIVPAKALLNELSEDVVERYFPENLLDRMVKAEEEAESEEEAE